MCSSPTSNFSLNLSTTCSSINEKEGFQQGYNRFYSLSEDVVKMISEPFTKQKWGKSPCILFPICSEYDPAHFLISDTFCGENMHMTTYPVSWSSVIGVWYSESKYFKYGIWPSADDDISTDRYTQVTCVLENMHIV